MDRCELAALAAVLREEALDVFHIYARDRCPAVPRLEVEAIAAALTDVLTLEEATTALDTLQQEYDAPRLTTRGKEIRH